MRRRDILRNCAVLGATGGLSLLAGCSGGGDDRETKQASLSVETFDYHEGDSGNFVVTVTVKNAGKDAATGRLYVTVTAAETTSENGSDGGGTTASRESLEVTVPAGETKTVTIPFEFTVEQFQRNGSLNVDLRT